MRNFGKIMSVLVMICLLMQQNVLASEVVPEKKQAIVLAMFGTSVESGLKGLMGVKREVEKAYPQTTIKMAFTSNIIRKIWQRRAANPNYSRLHPEIDKEILHVQGPLATIANLQDSGYKTIIVQPTHLSLGEEFLDLSTYVKALASIETIKSRFKPFDKLVIGRPAMGTFGSTHSYGDDILAIAKALDVDMELARKEKVAFLYMGHGNDHFPSGGAYLQLEKELRVMYPDVATYIGNVEGFPSFDDVFVKLKKDGVSKLIAKPFMVVAGDHAKNDMAGDEADSWKSMLEKEGIQVETILHGLGENPAFAKVFVSHIADTAKDAGIKLQ